MKRAVLSLLFLSAVAVVNAYGQTYVSSASDLNGAILSAVNGDTITVTGDFVADVDISTIDALNITIGNDNSAADYTLSGDNAYKGFCITNSTVSVNNVNLSSFSISTPGFYGSALYANGSAIKYTGNNISFANNGISVIYTEPDNEHSYGGAICTLNSSFSLTASGSISFLSNSVYAYCNRNPSVSYDGGKGYGGAIYASDSDFSIVSGGDIVFSGNSAVGDHDSSNYSRWSYGFGGAIYALNSSLSLVSSGGNIIFSSNTAAAVNNAHGGAIFNDAGSSITLNGNVIFIGNSITRGAWYRYGGAIYNITGAQISMAGSAQFIGNSAVGAGIGSGGGAIFNSGIVDIENGLFTSNTGGNGGGAIYNNNGTVNIGSGSFTSNSASGYNGGAIFNTGGGQINISGSVDFVSNTGSNGAAIYNDANSVINASAGSFVSFESHTVTGSGAAIYNAGSISMASGSFSFNSASSGGAIFNAGDITFANGDTSFTGNTASFGGAIFTYNSSGGSSNISFGGGTINFINNKAEGFGGALYISGAWYGSIYGSTVSFNTDGGEAVFRGNSADGAPNDVYMDVGSYLNISGAKAIRFEDGIIADTAAVINKSEAGAMYLGGNNEIWGAFNISGGDIVLMANTKYKGMSLEVANGSSGLDMHNGTAETVYLVDNFASDKNLKMDIFADGTNDRIQCTSATISGNLDIFAGVGTYQAKEFDLIITSGTGYLTGTFASSTINNRGLNYELRYEDGIVKLIVDGVTVTNFSALSPLTYNQRQTAGAFDKLSANPGNWAPILTDMMLKQENGTDADIAAIKDFLSRTSGYFLSNVIRNMAADSPNNEVYDKIRCRDAGMQGCGVTDSNGLWVQLRGGLETFKKDENSLEDYRDLSYGVMAGFDRFLADKLAGGDVTWGVYGRFNKNNIEQGENKADGNNNGLGFYGGYIRDSWELKAMLLGSYDMFSTQRMAYNSQVAKADITGVTVSADLEAAIKIWMSDNMNLRPYAGIEAANTMYGGFKESGAGMYDLDTRSGDYLRSAGRVGAGLDYEKGIWIWYANVEGKYVFEGTKPEIKSQFTDTGIDFYSRGADEKNLEIGAGAGAEVRISRHWKGFANAKYYVGEKYENIYGNIGIRYLFGNNKAAREKKEEAIKKKAAETAALEAKKEEDEEAAALEAQRKAWEKKAALEAQKVQAEEEAKAKRIEEEAKITKEISDADLAKQKAEAEARRNRPMLKTYTLTTHFDTNSYFLSEEDKRQISKIAEEVKNYDYKKIAIEGHTDSTGSKETNKRLSRQRARSVYDEFAKNGVDKTKLTYEGFAAELPVESNETAEGRAANRRTEIFVE